MYDLDGIYTPYIESHDLHDAVADIEFNEYVREMSR